MNDLFQQTIDAINASNIIVFTTHENTDGDDFGTVSAIAQYCLNLGKKIRIVIKGGIPKNLQFINLSLSVTETEPTEKYDLIFLSGCSNIERPNFLWIKESNVKKINFDHHPDNTRFADINVVDSSKSSVAELAFDFLKFANTNISSKMATALLAGIFTDTGSFRHSTTQSSTLLSASELIKAGADLKTIYTQTFSSKNLTTLNTWGKLLNTIQKPNESLSYIIADKEITVNQESKNELDGISETILKDKNTLYALLLKEQIDEGYRGSLRSEKFKGVDVRALAARLGGGGHKYASGFKSKLSVKEIIQNLTE